MRTLWVRSLMRIDKYLKAFACMLIAGPVLAHDENDIDLFSLSLEELTQIRVVTASPHEHTQFTAPIAVSSISYEEIQRSNVSSIPEALRLVPGVIVKEESRGNYDIYIRGLDGVPPGNAPVFSTNSSTLVMVDYKPVYNWFTGGVYWSGLGISIDDVDRIEVVRGPYTALYGPNAANGVIHILTRQAKESGWRHSGAIAAGSEEFQQGRWRSEFSSSSLSVAVHGHIDERGRSEQLYYGFETSQLEDAQDLEILASGAPYLSQFPEALIHPESGLKESGFGVSGHYRWSEDHQTDLSYRQFDSEFHDTIIENATTPLTYIEYRGDAFQMKHRYQNTQFSYSRDTSLQDLHGSEILDFENVVEHFQIESKKEFDRLEIYGQVFHASARTDSVLLLGSNNKRALSNSAIGFHLNYELNTKWQFIAAYREDKMSTEQGNESSYQIGAVFTPNPNNSFWVNYGKAFRSPFVLDSYTELSTPPVDDVFLRFSGNEALDLLTVYETQLGWRNQHDGNSIQAEVFHRTVDNFSTFSFLGLIPEEGNTVISYQWVNVPTQVEQTGITLDYQWQYSRRMSINAFLTLQQTKLADRQEIAGITEPYDETFQGTPTAFGGLNTYFQLSDSTLISLENYYLGEHTQEYGYGFTVSGSSPENVSQEIPSKWLTDVGINYSIGRNIQLKGMIKNVFDDSHNEFLYADPTPRRVIVQAKVLF